MKMRSGMSPATNRTYWAGLIVFNNSSPCKSGKCDNCNKFLNWHNIIHEKHKTSSSSFTCPHCCRKFGLK